MQKVVFVPGVKINPASKNPFKNCNLEALQQSFQSQWSDFIVLIQFLSVWSRGPFFVFNNYYNYL